MTASNEAVLSISQPLVVNAGTDQVIPPGTSTILTGIVDGGSGFYSYSWEPANLLQDPQLSITPTTELTESVTFTLTVIDISTGCTANDQVGIIMGNPNLPPVANADYDTASILNPAYIIILNNDMDPDGTIDSVTILLQPSHGTATLNPDKTITYIPTGGFEGVDTLIYLICDNGMPVLCDTALVTIRVFGTRPFDDIIIYNYLTPNGDNYNDTWIIDNIQFWPENVILLYNRWGDRIRAFEHYDNTTVYWDGTNDEGEHVPDGTYYYIVRVRHIDSMSGTMREDAKTGFVMVRANRK
jgi:gliding motility-associated-like protein